MYLLHLLDVSKYASRKVIKKGNTATFHSDQQMLVKNTLHKTIRPFKTAKFLYICVFRVYDRGKLF